MQQQLPESIGHQGAYKILEVLGRGGFATVYKAHQVSLDKFVAIKVLRRDFLDDPNDLERFKREARALARLEGHPNIIRVYDYGDHEGMAYLVMEYIDGETLQKRLSRPIEPPEIIHIVNSVASALDHAHRNGLIHRDIKPSNVLLHKDGRIILTDFGIAKVIEATTAGMTGAGMGTPEYMAPEQVEGHEVTTAADIYALGIVAYQLLSGKLPFAGAPMTVMHKQVHEPPPSLTSLGRPIGEDTAMVVGRALSKRPDQRFASAGAFARALTTTLERASQRGVHFQSTLVQPAEPPQSYRTPGSGGYSQRPPDHPQPHDFGPRVLGGQTAPLPEPTSSSGYPSDPLQTQVEHLYHEGRTLATQGHYPDAAQRFRAALALNERFTPARSALQDMEARISSSSGPQYFAPQPSPGGGFFGSTFYVLASVVSGIGVACFLLLLLYGLASGKLL